MELAVSGFRATGISPFNRHKFTEEDFVAAGEDADSSESINEQQTDDQQPHATSPVSEIKEASTSAERSTQPLEQDVDVTCRLIINEISPRRTMKLSKKKTENSRKQSSTVLHATPVKSILQKKGVLPKSLSLTFLHHVMYDSLAGPRRRKERYISLFGLRIKTLSTKTLALFALNILTTVVPERNGCGAAIVDVGHMMLVLLAMLCTFVTTVKWTNFVAYGVICAYQCYFVNK